MAWSLLQHTAGIRVFVFLLVFHFLFQSSICELKNCHHFETPGITIPEGDIIIEHGNPLDIYCKLHDKYLHNISSADIEFISNSTTIPSEWVKQLNKSTAQLHVDKPLPSRSVYTCKLKGIEKAICMNHVTVGTKPSKVENFSCIGYNFQNLTCSWIQPDHYVATTYNFTYYFMGRNSRSYFRCPKLTKNGNNVSCFWDVTTYPSYRQSQATYNFVFKMSNKFGNNTQKIPFMHYARVVPGPVENLTVINKTSESVTLSWSVRHPMNSFPRPVNYRVVYQSEFDKFDKDKDKDKWHVADTSSINKSGNMNPVFNLTGLKYAHVLYDIRVSMISGSAIQDDETMWSKNVSVTARTKSALPGAAPRTVVGSFEIVNNKTGRDVYLYWQSIPEHLKNGENFSYRVIVFKDESLGNRVIEPVEITNSYARIVSISYYKRYRFKIVSENEVGQSVNSSEIIIPSHNEQVSEPSSFTKISYGNQVYELSWIPPVNDNIVKNYTIFYCRNDYDRPFQCKGYLNWTVVDSNITVINVTIPEDKIYQFAISANSENSSSGMVWASCTVIHDKGDTKMKSVWINNIGSDYIEVGWKLDCSDRVGNIEGFTIDYCTIVSPIDSICNGTVQSITVTGDPVASRGKIINLRPYTTYRLTVSVKSKHNNGLPSDPLYNTTLEGAPDPPENVTVTNVTSTSMVVHWSPPKNMNGVLRYYELRAYEPNGREIKERPSPDQKSSTITLTGLNTYTEYTIRVYAVTVKESNSSRPITVKTSITVPGKMQSPVISFQNDSLIVIGWNPPNPAGGNLEVYELRIKEKINSVNYTKYFNTSGTERQLDVPNCGVDRNYKVLYFAIRAINYDEKLDKRYEGDWSDETEYYCRESTRFVYWFAIVCGICVLIFVAYVMRKLWHRCKIMQDVEVKLPPGLSPPIANDVSLHHFPVTVQKSSTDGQLMHIQSDFSADEELLLAKKAECGESHDRITSGDSSGCSSGHESVTSSLASGTNLSSTSDSGTEQPRTPSSESVSRENSLRQRRTGSETLGWDSEIAWPNPKGYVLTMPLNDKSALSSPRNKSISPSNYCVLGVDTAPPPADTGIHGGYVPVPVSAPHSESPNKNSPYITCDSLFTKPTEGGSPAHTKSPAYVKSSDAALIGRPVTSIATSPPQGSKNLSSPTYVVAGNKNRSYVKPSGPDILSTGKLINIEPLHDVAIDSYMQHSTELDKTDSSAANTSLDNLASGPISTTSPYVKADDILSLKDRVTTVAAKSAEDQTLSASTETPDEQQPPLNSYCRLGWDRTAAATAPETFTVSSPRTAVMEPNKGYVPHRQFENKSLKED